MTKPTTTPTTPTTPAVLENEVEEMRPSQWPSCAHCKLPLRFEEEISTTLCVVCIQERRFQTATGPLLAAYLRTYGLTTRADEPDEVARGRLLAEAEKISGQASERTKEHATQTPRRNEGTIKQREVHRVVDAMLAEIPATEEDLRRELSGVRNSSMFTPPEGATRLWRRVQAILVVRVGEPRTGWQLRVAAIFRGDVKAVGATAATTTQTVATTLAETDVVAAVDPCPDCRRPRVANAPRRIPLRLVPHCCWRTYAEGSDAAFSAEDALSDCRRYAQEKVLPDPPKLPPTRPPTPIRDF